MTFDYAEYLAFVQFLYKHPELRAEVRKVVLSEDILTLPQVVRELAEAQKRTEQRVEELAEAQKRTEQRVEELAEAQKRSEERLTRLETAVAELAEAQKRTEQRVEELAEAQKRTDERLTRVEQRMDSLEIEMKKTRSEVAGLAAAFGSTLEEEAASVVEIRHAPQGIPSAGRSHHPALQRRCGCGLAGRNPRRQASAGGGRDRRRA